MSLRKYIPASWRLCYKLARRRSKDRSSGLNKRFAKHRVAIMGKQQLSITQTIKKSHLYENKVNNISVGGERMNGLIVKPNEVISFWELVGVPSKKNGFKVGRNLIDGKVKEDFGGGLCQLASITYHLALLAGLEIIERTNHTVDIYLESERFTPLGADASVVYGYKDLRIVNNKDFPIQLHYIVNKEVITASLYSNEKIEEIKLDFKREYKESKVEVKGIDDNGQIVNKSSYVLKD